MPKLAILARLRGRVGDLVRRLAAELVHSRTSSGSFLISAPPVIVNYCLALLRNVALHEAGIGPDPKMPRHDIDDRNGRPIVKVRFRMFAGRRHKRCC